MRIRTVGTRLLTMSAGAKVVVDPAYPGTAVGRMSAARERAGSLSAEDLSGDWTEVRRKLLWAAGLKDLPHARPGMGYTGHAFNDSNHCDATCMLGDVSHNLNDGTERVAGIAVGNRLGPGIEIASLPELGEGGSWSTCTNGCHLDPPRDVAHVQFRSRIAWKLVWCPPEFTSFVLVDDDGLQLASGTPTGSLPRLSERRTNFGLVKGSKYATAATKIGGGIPKEAICAKCGD
mmetsp:Transcript_24915/g.75032  ORF Transcript_24915/g.75032 Transcript_24915/m.75032 type:complete len:233 (-) Transcript_24915:116-814(-)